MHPTASCFYPFQPDTSSGCYRGNAGGVQDWHQKLHNNTTPDDVIICEAYIKFLEGNGDNGSYWAHLTDNGITRQRLESFDRAIKA